MHVLIVEDESDLRDSLVEGLTSAMPHLAVVGAESVEQAYELIANDEPQLIISDIRLPGKSGLQFLLDLNTERPQTRFILMSAFAFPAVYNEQRPSGLVRFLSKPFDFDELIASVNDTLGARPGFSGRVSGLSVTDVLQVMNLGRRHGTMTVQHAGTSGAIVIRSGEIVHAETGALTGLQAWKEIFSWDGGEFTLEEGESEAAPTIDEPFHFLLLDAAKTLDEGDADNSQPTDGSSEPHQERSPFMADISEVCKVMVEDTPDAVAANVVDLSSGMMLGGHFRSDFTSDHFEAVSAAATNLYRGRDTLRVESLVKAQRGDDTDQHFVEEVLLSTTSLHHFIKKFDGKEAIVTLVTRRPGNIGMGWSALRGKLKELEPLIPS